MLAKKLEKMGVVLVVASGTGTAVHETLSVEIETVSVAAVTDSALMFQRITIDSPMGTVLPRSSVIDPPAFTVALVLFTTPIRLFSFVTPVKPGSTAAALPVVWGIIQVVRSMGPLVLHTAVGAENRDPSRTSGARVPSTAYARNPFSLLGPASGKPGMAMLLVKWPAITIPPMASASTPYTYCVAGVLIVSSKRALPFWRSVSTKRSSVSVEVAVCAATAMPPP